MSTLGDLLAEHTMLPGNAVDHLHAVVGEWQLLADLSFADYLMWVRRDDGVLVCVAQCRPNTAPTVLQTDAVGTAIASERLSSSPTPSRRAPPRGMTLRVKRIRGCRARTSRRPRCDTAARWSPCSRIIRPRWPPTARPGSWRSPIGSAPATSSTCSPRAPFPTRGTW